jgi:hypothetical protein
MWLLRALRRRRARQVDTSLPYVAVPSLLSRPEHAFYQVLLSLTAPEHLVAPKVRLADLARVDKARYPDGTPEEHRAFRQVAPLHVDFVLCERQSLRPVLAIELDGTSHQTNARQIASDAWKQRILDHIGLPLLRVPYRDTYNTRDLGAAIQSRLA